MTSFKGFVTEGLYPYPFQMNEMKLSPLILAELGVRLTQYWDFVAYPERSENGIPFTAKFLEIKHAYISLTFASRYTNMQPTDVKKDIRANDMITIWFRFKGILSRHQLTVRVVEKSVIEDIVRRKTAYHGTISGAKGDPDMLLGVDYALGKRFVCSSLEYRPMPEERKAKTQSTSQETGIPVGIAGQSKHRSILSLPTEIIQSICGWAVTPVAGEVLVARMGHVSEGPLRLGHTPEGPLRFFETKDFCDTCISRSSCDLHPTWRSYPGHQLIVGPLIVGLFRTHRRLSTILRQMFYSKTKFHFHCDSDLIYFCATLGTENLTLIRHISLLNWESLDRMPSHLPGLRTVDAWIKKSVLQTSSEFGDLAESFEIVRSEFQLRVILFEEESNVLESDGDDDDEYDNV